LSSTHGDRRGGHSWRWVISPNPSSAKRVIKARDLVWPTNTCTVHGTPASMVFESMLNGPSPRSSR
jgi:hypothetical protein